MPGPGLFTSAVTRRWLEPALSALGAAALVAVGAVAGLVTAWVGVAAGAALGFAAVGAASLLAALLGAPGHTSPRPQRPAIVAEHLASFDEEDTAALVVELDDLRERCHSLYVEATGFEVDAVG